MTRYRQGYRVEQLARKQLEENGYTVFRTAGSRGIVDLIAVDINIVRFIQVKKGQISARERQRLEKWKETIPENCTVEIWVKKPKKFYITKL